MSGDLITDVHSLFDYGKWQVRTTSFLKSAAQIKTPTFDEIFRGAGMYHIKMHPKSSVVADAPAAPSDGPVDPASVYIPDDE
jgi:hypothetical protein